MIKKAWLSLPVVGLAVLLALNLPGSSLAAGKTYTTKLKKAASTANDPNIKHEAIDNSKPVPAANAPKAKGGKTSKGIPGTLHVDNHLGYYIQIYYNGNNVGTVGPFGDLYVNIGDFSGTTAVLYAIVPGIPYTLGPINVNVSGDFAWNLNP